MSFPPGLLFVAQATPQLAFPPLLVFVVHHYSSYSLPSYIWLIAYLLVNPAVLIAYGTLQHIREEREIRKLGARRVPLAPSSVPGGLDNLMAALRSFGSGYPGTLSSISIETYAQTDFIKQLTYGGNGWMQSTILTTEPEHIKAILATDFDNFDKGDVFRWYMHSVLGTGVFNSDGERWKFHRSMTRPFFGRERVTDFELFNQHADMVIQKLEERFAQGEAVDFQDIMSRFTLDSATEFLFGSSVHSLDAPLPYAHNSPRRELASRTPHSSDMFSKAFGQAQTQIATRTRLAAMWPLMEFWKDKTKDSTKIIYNFIDPILKESLAKKAVADGADSQAKTLADHLVDHTTDLVIIRDEILNIMIAGRDTTMATLTFAVYCLSQNKDVLIKLRQEILTMVGPTRTPVFDDVKDCKYLRAVINETLRLYPAVPIDARQSKRATTWPASDGGKPYYLPAGTDVPYAVWLMHRRTDLWGPDASEFDPDRFLDARLHKYLTPNPFIFLPFNAGPRICLGQQFAYNEISVMLIRLLQAFDTITLAPEAQPAESHPPASWKQTSGTQATTKIWPKVHLTLYSYMGLWLRMGEADRT
ncbi:cytochrome P450 [Gautieria morchelliformis]|nr:cytochrome P450 [Gautieria morchelliformis]